MNPTQTVMDFDGVTYESEFDQDRLNAQLRRCWDAMKDTRWRTLDELGRITGDMTQSLSARLRDFRKERFGAHTVNRRRRGASSDGLFEYQLIPRGYDGATIAP